VDSVRLELNAEGMAAYDRAVTVTGGDERLADAVARFARAVDAASEARAEWIAEGRPFLLTRPSGRLARHPLVDVVMMLERDVLRSADALGMTPRVAAPRRRPGRPAGSTSAADRRIAPVCQSIVSPTASK